LEAESEVGAGPVPPDELLELLEAPLDDPLELLEPPELEPLEPLEVPESSPPELEAPELLESSPPELEAPELLDPLEPPPDPPLEPPPMSDGDDEGEPHATRSNAKTLGAIVDMRFMGFLWSGSSARCLRDEPSARAYATFRTRYARETETGNAILRCRQQHGE
jgi:hypothetical protein